MPRRLDGPRGFFRPDGFLCVVNNIHCWSVQGCRPAPVGEFDAEAGRVGHDTTGEVQVLSNWKWISAMAFAAAAAGCGGGGEPTARGAIAYSTNTGNGAIVVNHASQQEANSDAVAQCGAVGCAVRLEFSGNGTCGAIAVASNGAWGVGSGSSKESADTRAVGDCQKRGGGDCVIPHGLETQCN